MKYTCLFFSILLLGRLVEAAENKDNGLPLAIRCDEDLCKLPDCRCSSTEIPGGLEPRDVPQFVTVTFDDAITVRNIETYREVLYNRLNSNGCPYGTTFYINHEYTDYTLVNELYNQQFEIALHSISHQTSQSYWQNAQYEDMMKEFGDQIGQMAHFANIPPESIKGVRIPFLQMTGNSTFQVMVDKGLVYDCTWPTNTYTDPGLWPYTLDFASIQECNVPPCPSASIPGVWVQPMISWRDLNGVPCAMVDSCFFVPPVTGEDSTEQWFDFIKSNFLRHYEGNRTPFPFYIHEWYLEVHRPVKLALSWFLDWVKDLPDVFVVNSDEVIEWVKDPIKVSDYANKPCKRHTMTTCSRSSCGPLRAQHNQLDYWMQICNTCPRVYPWLNNPLGV